MKLLIGENQAVRKNWPLLIYGIDFRWFYDHIVLFLCWQLDYNDTSEIRLTVQIEIPASADKVQEQNNVCRSECYIYYEWMDFYYVCLLLAARLEVCHSKGIARLEVDPAIFICQGSSLFM